MPTLGICRVCGANTTGGVHCPDCLRVPYSHGDALPEGVFWGDVDAAEPARQPACEHRAALPMGPRFMRCTDCGETWPA